MHLPKAIGETVMNLYYAEGDQQVGPIGKVELQNLIKTKKLNAKTLVWEAGMESWQELGLYVRSKTRGKQDPGTPSETASQIPCSQCGKLFHQTDTVLIKNSRVCAACKPLALQKIKEGVSTIAARTSDLYGSLEKGLKGQYQINVSEIISEAWELTNGSKLAIIGALFITWIISGIIQQMISIPITILFGIFAASFEKVMGTPESAVLLSVGLFAVAMLIGFGSMLVQVPMLVGLEMIGVRRSVGLPISVKYVFNYFKNFIPLALTWLMMSILMLLGYLFLIIPGIYLTVATFLALQLVADRQLGPWEAVKTSIKATTHNWFAIFLLLLALFCIMAISCIPLGIGLIWTLPLFFIAKGILYRNVFGVQESE
jgi:hypothetical protein